jgi:hypothetical protein
MALLPRGSGSGHPGRGGYMSLLVRAYHQETARTPRSPVD